MSRACCAGKLASNVFKSALGSRDPGVDRPGWFVPNLLLMSAFEFSYPLAIFVQVIVGGPSLNATNFRLHRLHGVCQGESSCLCM